MGPFPRGLRVLTHIGVGGPDCLADELRAMRTRLAHLFSESAKYMENRKKSSGRNADFSKLKFKGLEVNFLRAEQAIFDALKNDLAIRNLCTGASLLRTPTIAANASSCAVIGLKCHKHTFQTLHLGLLPPTNHTVASCVAIRSDRPELPCSNPEPGTASQCVALPFRRRSPKPDSELSYSAESAADEHAHRLGRRNLGRRSEPKGHPAVAPKEMLSTES
jgi:hypothetical protein